MEKPRVLVVNEEENIRDALRMILEDEYFFEEVSSGRKAIQRIKEDETIKLVIVGDQISDMSDFELLDALKDIGEKHPEIITGPMGDWEVLDEYKEIGVCGCFFQPLDTGKIQKVIKACLRS